MADVLARSHGGDTSGSGGGGGPPDGDQPCQLPSQCESEGGSGSGSGSMRGQGERGKTTMLGVRKRQAVGELLTIEFEEGAYNTQKPVGPNAAQFASLVGTIINEFPQFHATWGKLPQEYKATIWPGLRSYFKMNEHEHLRPGIMRYAGTLYRGHKHRFKQKFFTKKGGEERPDILDVVPPHLSESEWDDHVKYYTSPKVKARSETNTTNKSKHKFTGHKGRTSLAQCRFKFRTDPFSAILGFKDYYTDDKGNFYEPEVAAAYDEMQRLQRERPDLSERQIMRQALGETPTWERGIGPIPTLASQYVAPPPPPPLNQGNMVSQAEVEEIVATRIAAERSQWEQEAMTRMMSQMQSQMQSQIQSQVQDALKKANASQQNDASTSRDSDDNEDDP